MGTGKIGRLGACALASAAVAAGVAGSAGGARSTSPPLRGVNFISVCQFSHRGPDDPIVLPRQPGYSHDHTFVGNTTTDAYSTPARLRSGGTTCRRQADKAAYWMPTLSVGGDPVTPTVAIAYYQRHTKAAVKPFPPALQMIGGNSGSTVPQSLLVTYWDCGDLVNVPRSSNIPDCRDGALSLHVNFPDCWDGSGLLYENGKHLRYSSNGRCPKTHPVALPALSLVFRYPVQTPAGPAALSSGGQHSGHADFINAWDQNVLASLVAGCLNRYRHCGTGS